jgi:hypothetical protein
LYTQSHILTRLAKAVELFLRNLVNETISTAQNAESSKIANHHLKHSINAIERFDFLKELVKDIPEPVEKPKARKKRTRKQDGTNKRVHTEEGDE